MNSLFKRAGVIVLALVTFSVVILFSNSFLKGARIDLTEHQLFTLTQGSRNIVAGIEEPIHLYLYFSESTTRDLTQLRTYADRVAALLEEYVSLSQGKLILNRIDPEPFSAAEDDADRYGLQSIPVNGAGDTLYFGLVGSNALDDVEVIAFFQPDKEVFLEYDISQLIYRLSQPSKPRIGLLAGLSVRDRVNPQTFSSEPGWRSIAELEQNFEVVEIAADAETIDENLTMLLLIHPKTISSALQDQIRQFLARGGAILAFVDPLSEMDVTQSSPMMPTLPGGQNSDLNWLTEPWGISIRPGQILGDAQLALSVTGSGGAPVRHLGIIGLGPDQLNSDEVVTSQLESINVSTVGIIDIEEPKVDVTRLLTSSVFAAGMDAGQFQFLQDPESLQKTFKPGDVALPIAVSLQGPLPLSDILGDPSASTEARRISLTLVSDTDVLSDRLWVQVQNFFGQSIATAWADNGSFLINAVDFQAGSADLISIRSRGQYTRPFEVVQTLRRDAEARYLESADQLQLELAETEQRLSELESQKVADGLLTLSADQEAALLEFQDRKLTIRKQLREVRHQLDQDIEDLGATLKLLNIAVLPLLITLLLGLMVGLRRLRGARPS
ncbi:MAG: Gldg family protein [Pseudomonadales bacterium]